MCPFPPLSLALIFFVKALAIHILNLGKYLIHSICIAHHFVAYSVQGAAFFFNWKLLSCLESGFKWSKFLSLFRLAHPFAWLGGPAEGQDLLVAQLGKPGVGWDKNDGPDQIHKVFQYRALTFGREMGQILGDSSILTKHVVFF